MSIARRGPAATPVITVDGAFDSDAAGMLLALVADVPADATLTLDFRDVRLFHDCAIQRLAEAIAGHHPVRVIGLSEHHYRLLRYMSPDASLDG